MQTFQKAHPHVRARQLLSVAIVSVFIIVGFVGSSFADTTGATSSGAVTLARAENVQAKDLPKDVSWTALPETPITAAGRAAGRAAMACLKQHGVRTLSGDPFGLGSTGPGVGADVSSPLYVQKGSFTQLPSVNSEVVVVKDGALAGADLQAFSLKTGLSCPAIQLQSETSAGGAGKVKVSASLATLAHYGGGNGGVHVRYVVSGGELPAPLYVDGYFYIQGKSEIDLTFINLATPFSSTWAADIATSVMNRARSLN